MDAIDEEMGRSHSRHKLYEHIKAPNRSKNEIAFNREKFNDKVITLNWKRKQKCIILTVVSSFSTVSICQRLFGANLQTKANK